MNRLSNKLSMLAAASAILLAVAGCTINVGTQEPVADPHAGHMMDKGESSDYDAIDVMFAQMMIPHHEQAVEMSLLAPTRTQNQAVLDLAAAIAAEQDPEILQMQSWLDAAGAGRDMGHEMAMGGMLSEEEIELLATLSGAEFEKFFLEGMIEHHEGAIDMAQMIVNSDNVEARGLANAIISSQTEQIEYMRELLANY